MRLMSTIFCSKSVFKGSLSNMSIFSIWNFLIIFISNLVTIVQDLPNFGIEKRVWAASSYLLLFRHFVSLCELTRATSSVPLKISCCSIGVLTYLFCSGLLTNIKRIKLSKQSSKTRLLAKLRHKISLIYLYVCLHLYSYL